MPNQNTLSVMLPSLIVLIVTSALFVLLFNKCGVMLSALQLQQDLFLPQLQVLIPLLNAYQESLLFQTRPSEAIPSSFKTSQTLGLLPLPRVLALEKLARVNHAVLKQDTPSMDVQLWQADSAGLELASSKPVLEPQSVPTLITLLQLTLSLSNGFAPRSSILLHTLPDGSLIIHHSTSSQ